VIKDRKQKRNGNIKSAKEKQQEGKAKRRNEAIRS
jgi:hypothetical protein